MLTQNNRTATDSGARWSKPKGVGRCAAVLGCLVLGLLGSEQLAAQKPATNVNGNLIPREMGDIPDVTIQYQQFDKKPLKFSARAHYILVPVIVTEKDGKHVTGLTKDAFQIFENGKEQNIASVDETQTSAVPVQSVPASLNEFSNAITVEGGARRINVIALDLINTPFLDQVGARRAAIRYLANSINQDAIFELVSIDGNGMHVLHDFTSDTKVLVTALKKVASQLDAMTGTETNAIHQVTGGSGLEQKSGVFVSYQSRDQSLVDLDSTALEAFVKGAAPIADFAQVGAVGSTLGAFQQIAHQLSGIPGRKSLFWITGSFPFDIDETSGSISVGTPLDSYQRTMQLLNDANVSLYPVDARGVVVVGEMDATMKVSREMMHSIPAIYGGRVAKPSEDGGYHAHLRGYDRRQGLLQ